MMRYRSKREAALNAAALFLGCLVLPALAAGAQEGFSPAFYTSQGMSSGVGTIVVFPPGGSRFEVPVPAVLQKVLYDAYRPAVYATAFQKSGLVRVFLDPPRVDPIKGSAAFTNIAGFSVTGGGDAVVISGTRTDAGRRTCGVFEMDVPTGGVHSIAESDECESTPWGKISVLSPDGKAGVTQHRPKIDSLGRIVDKSQEFPYGLLLLSFATGTTKVLAPLTEFVNRFSWSPDGKWIAVTYNFRSPDNGQVAMRSALIDPSAPDRSNWRELGGVVDTDVVWSPDSRFLLHAIRLGNCGAQGNRTLETIEISSGKRTAVADSFCRVASDSIGWIDADLLRH